MSLSNSCEEKEMGELQYTVILELDEEDGSYTATVPALPGCISQGDTAEDALENIKEAILGYIEDLKKHGEAIPVEVTPPQVAKVTIAA